MTTTLRRECDTIPPDRGCVESPSCLACPLPMCVLDLAKPHYNRHQRIRDLHNDGFSIRDIASIEHASMRTVWRVLHEA